REVDVRRQVPEEDQVEVLGANRRRAQRLARRLEAEVGRARVRGDEAALADARALLDPLVAGVHQLGEIVVGHHALRYVAPAAEDAAVRPARGVAHLASVLTARAPPPPTTSPTRRPRSRRCRRGPRAPRAPPS